MEGEISYHLTGRGDSTRHCYLEGGDKKRPAGLELGQHSDSKRISRGRSEKEDRKFAFGLAEFENACNPSGWN